MGPSGEAQATPAPVLEAVRPPQAGPPPSLSPNHRRPLRAPARRGDRPPQGRRRLASADGPHGRRALGVPLTHRPWLPPYTGPPAQRSSALDATFPRPGATRGRTRDEVQGVAEDWD